MDLLRAPAATFALAALVAVGPRAVWADPLTDALTRGGVQPVMPVTEAVDFTLGDLAGEEVSLSDFRGKWVLLTFWATWCGPCLSEMPSLQRFSEEFADEGFVVLAVAVGSQPQEVQRTVQRHQLDFPVLIDSGDKVATRYRAWSVPLTYLVNPAGQLVGVVRGARDWSLAGNMVRELAGVEVAAAEPSQRADDAVLELPPDLVPPTAEVAVAAGEVSAGEPFELQILVRWADAGQDYRIHPPRLDLPSGVTQGATSASSSSQDGTRVLTYTVELTAEEPGTLGLEPVEIRFTPEGSDKPLATRVDAPTVVVQADRGAGAAAAAGCVVIVAAVIALGAWRRRRTTSRNEGRQ